MSNSSDSIKSQQLDSLVSYEDLILKENSLERISVKKGLDNLFACISYHLYGNQANTEMIQKKCHFLLGQMIATNSLPRRLGFFYNNESITQSYFANINHSNFDMVNFELISIIFKRTIHIYEIDENSFLRCCIINGSFENPLMVFCDKLKNYDPLISSSFSKTFVEFKELTLEIVEKAINKNSRLDARRDSDSFFEQLNDDIKKFSLENEEPIILESGFEEKSSENLNSCSNSGNLKNQFSLKLKMPPKLTIGSNSDFRTAELNNHNNDYNFNEFNANNSDTFDALHKSFTPLSYVQTVDDPHQKFSWDNELINDQKKNHSFSSFCPFNYSYQQQLDFYNSKGQTNIMYGNIPQKNKPLVLEESATRYLGTLKFFDEYKSFGFIIMDVNNSEIFFHFDDFEQIGVTKEMLMTYKNGNIIRLSFGCMKYIGKYNISMKAIEIKLLSIRKSK